MPSLRQSIKRNSRTSSPFVRTANTSPAPIPAPAVEPKKERAQGSLDGWVEPPLRSPVPSFQDYGMERTSLFSEMAPLGAMPPMRLKIRVKGDSRPDRLESLPSSDVASGTPERSPLLDTKSSKPASQEPSEVDADQAVKESDEEKAQEADDQAFATNGQSAVTPQVLSPIVHNGTPTPVHSRHTSTSKASQFSPKRALDMASQSARDPSRSERMERVVRRALDLAESQGQPVLGATIARFYQETHNNPQLATIFDAVVLKRETEDQKSKFRDEMRRIKKLLKRESSTRARTMSNSIPPEGYSAHSQTIPTMGHPHPSIGFPTTIGYQQPHINQRQPYAPTPPQQLPSPFSTFRASFHPFSPVTQTSPTSPTKPSLPHHPPPIGTFGPPRPSLTPINVPPAADFPPPQESDQPFPMAVETRRARTARANAPAAATNATAQTTNAPPTAPVPALPVNAIPTSVSNGAKKSKTEAVAGKAASAKPGPKPGKSPKKSARTRSKSVESVSSLSSVDDSIVREGNPSAPTATVATESAQPSRVVSRSATPRLGLNTKTKQKRGHNLKAGTKRSASEVVVSEDEETVQRRRVAQANHDQALKRRREDEHPEPSYSSFRTSNDYVEAVVEKAREDGQENVRNYRKATAGTTSSAPKASAKERAADTATVPTLNVPTNTRRTRESTQIQRQGNEISGDGRANVVTPSTPNHPDSDGESNGGPPDQAELITKRRKTARTKFSPVKVPTYGVHALRAGPVSPIQSSPFSDGGREGKKPNRDQCYSCGCGGNLICCDMCQNAFHAECWDPPCTNSGDEMFEGYEWICTHCRIWDRRQENKERANRGEPLLTDDESSTAEDEAKTPTDFNLTDAPAAYAPKFIGQLKKGIQEWLPMQFGLQSVVRDAYDGYQVDIERRYKPVTKEAITVDSRIRPYEAIFDDGKHIKDPQDLKFCVKCGLTALSKKGDLVKCDTCTRFWHTDCLDPPTTAPPQTWSGKEKKGNRTIDAFKKRFWECPCHVDQDIVLFTNPSFYAGSPLPQRGIRARLPRRQIAALRDKAAPVQAQKPAQKVREAPSDTMLVQVEVDDTWWETYDKRMNDLKETGNTSFLLHENNIVADFAAKARRTATALAQTNDELIDAVCPNPAQCEGIKKDLHERQQAQIKAQVAAEVAAERAQINIRVQQEVEAALALQAMQDMGKGPNFTAFVADPCDESAVDKLVATMTRDQIGKIFSLLNAVEKKMDAQPEKALTQLAKGLDDDMDRILAGSKSAEKPEQSLKRKSSEMDEEEADEQPSSKRQALAEDEGQKAPTTSADGEQDRPVENEE